MIYRVRDAAEAAELANGSSHGLGGTVFSSDLQRRSGSQSNWTQAASASTTTWAL